MKIEEAKAYNALNIALDSNYTQLKNLFDQHGSWRKAFEKSVFNRKTDTDKEWQKLLSLEIELRLREDENFPEFLKEIPWPPFGIYIKGSFPDGVKIGIVGTRKATDVGKGIAKKIGGGLSRNGIVVVSGLALGVDEAAHRGVVEVEGRTIAVLAVGLDKVYPLQNANLAKRILSTKGCLISEYPVGAVSYPNRFIERNRIISGLSSAVIIIEAPERSGSLATAKFALDQNREVFVVPGPANHPNYSGSHSLIRAGARLAASAEEVLDDLNLQIKPEERNVEDLNEKQKNIFLVLEKAGQSLDIDKISELLKMGISELNREMTFLLLKGIIKEGGGKYYI